MPEFRKRIIPVSGIALITLFVVGWFLLPSRKAGTDGTVVAKVRRDTFRSIVTTSGELRAKNHAEIKGPPDAQAAQLYTLKITSIVPEGTLVDSGDIVAEI